MDLKDEAIDSFMKWLIDNGCKFENLRISNESNDRIGLYRSIYTEKPINEFSVIAKIPSKFSISSKGALNHPVLGPILMNYPDLQYGRTPMAVWLLYEVNLGESSFFYPWLRLLPRKLDLPMLWEKDELDELKGTSIYDRVLKDLNGLIDDYETVFTNTLFKYHSDLFKKENYTLDSYLWSWGILWSRNVELERGNTMTAHLLPLFDFINHDRSKSVTINLSFDEKDFVLRADNKLEAGDPITKAYVPEGSNSDILRMYGFIDPNNVYATAVLDIGLKEIDPYKKLRERWIKKHDLPRFPYPYNHMYATSEGIPNFVMAMARILTYDFDHEDAKKELNLLPDPSEEFPEEFEKIAFEFLRNTLKYKLKSYPTTIEEDEEILEDLTLPYRKQLAVEIRLEEKIAVYNSLETFKSQTIKIGETFKLGDRSGLLKPKRSKIRDIKE